MEKMGKVEFDIKVEAAKDILADEIINFIVNEFQKTADIKNQVEENKNFLIFEAITKDMLEIYKKKNMDYGDSFTDTFRKLGPKSAATRILDKANRFANLCDKEFSEVEESLFDTLLDLANYSVMTIIALDTESCCTQEE